MSKKRPNMSTLPSEKDVKPDYARKCSNCGSSPIVPLTGMCGPCTFGDSDTADGDW